MTKYWWQPSDPGALSDQPYLHPEAIAKLESLITPEFRILEHGSGGSTVWFANKCKSVLAIENDPDYYVAVIKQIPSNARVILSNNGNLPAHDEPYDLLLIDGEPLEDRIKWIKAAPQYVKMGGWVVLDNANREIYAEEREWLRGYCEKYFTVDGNDKIARYMITEFYKL